jgi:hypothetical protein
MKILLVFSLFAWFTTLILAAAILGLVLVFSNDSTIPTAHDDYFKDL